MQRCDSPPPPIKSGYWRTRANVHAKDAIKEADLLSCSFSLTQTTCLCTSWSQDSSHTSRIICPYPKEGKENRREALSRLLLRSLPELYTMHNFDCKKDWENEYFCFLAFRVKGEKGRSLGLVFIHPIHHTCQQAGRQQYQILHTIVRLFLDASILIFLTNLSDTSNLGWRGFAHLVYSDTQESSF